MDQLPPANPLPLLPVTRRRQYWLTALVALIIALNFILRVQTWQGADWQQFAFYDPGTVMKGDLLLAKGYIPTQDFGYTHGLLSLLYARLGFALLGRSPWAFLSLTLLTELVMAFAIVRILLGAGVSRKGWLVFLPAIPLAIMPSYLTLTHPLEAMLILLALAEQTNGHRPRSLALMTICIFVKPSMAYVYGLIILLLILFHHLKKRDPETNHIQWTKLLLALLPALTLFILLFLSLSAWFGTYPVIHTLLPTTGAKTYAMTGFGFFAESGRKFWLMSSPWDYLLSATGIYLLAATASLIGAAWATWRLTGNGSGNLAERPKLAHAYELLLMTGLLNTAFLLGFYGWEKSWTYYSYLPILGLTMTVVLLPVRRNIRRVVAIAIIILIGLSHSQVIGDIYNCFKWSIRMDQSESLLWVQQDTAADWKEVLSQVGTSETLVMSIGWIPNLPPNVHMPDAWFPEPGIPTKPEIDRVKKQIEKSEFLIIWAEYGKFDLWNSPDLAPYHLQFTKSFSTSYAGKDRFIVLHRVDVH